ncbi:MAG: biosynthetic-type acetolactate synthase large subunit [Deltaproteobacteria bacterium]|nr:biosynthetic-type acetolactate synthase large subunit [Deltaproteobacteria bacterium]
MEKTGADIILDTLSKEGVEVIFGYPGTNSLPIIDRISESSILHYLVRHEQAAAHAADGYARATGKVGVCLSTSGPGATNMVTGIATAYMDSTPLVALTAQVTSDLLGSDAFQETDIIGITMPITKHSFLINRVEKLESTLEEAIDIAKSGRPGPVLVDLPIDVINAPCPSSSKKKTRFTQKKGANREEIAAKVREIARHLNDAERPIIMIGGGIKLADACIPVSELIEQGRIPFVTTMMGIGSVHSPNGFNLGFIGTHGSELANRTVHQADFILAVGTRFSDRSTSKIEQFAPLATIAQIDIDPTSIGKNIKSDIALVSDISEAVKELTPLVKNRKRTEWLDRIEKDRSNIEEKHQSNGFGQVSEFIRTVQGIMGEDAIAVADVGLNQIWTLHSWRSNTPRGLITSGGMGTMGFSLPAAMGAKIGSPDREVIVFTGDGGFFMNIQELATISYYNLPVKIIVFNNGHLGMIRQFQDLFYGARFNACELGDKTDITAVGRGFGIPSEKIALNDPIPAIKRMEQAKGPYLLEVSVDPNNYVFPIIPPGRSNVEMIYGRPK